MVTGELDEEQRTLSIRVRGDILSTNAEACLSSASDILRKERAKEWEKVSLDLNSARMVDSVGLNAIIGLVKNLQAQNKPVTVYISSAAVHRVFLFSRLDTIVNIVFKAKRRRR